MQGVSAITNTVRRPATWESTARTAGETPTYWYRKIKPKKGAKGEEIVIIPDIICPDAEGQWTKSASGIGSKLNKLIN